VTNVLLLDALRRRERNTAAGGCCCCAVRCLATQVPQLNVLQHRHRGVKHLMVADRVPHTGGDSSAPQKS
jgi:hypothetical protein